MLGCHLLSSTGPVSLFLLTRHWLPTTYTLILAHLQACSVAIFCFAFSSSRRSFHSSAGPGFGLFPNRDTRPMPVQVSLAGEVTVTIHQRRKSCQHPNVGTLMIFTSHSNRIFHTYISCDTGDGPTNGKLMMLTNTTALA